MALDTPTGQQAADDAAQLAYHGHWWRFWEQGGLSTTTGYIDVSANPTAHYNWRKARSDENKTK